jgi:hypothetical protein
MSSSQSPFAPGWADSGHRTQVAYPTVRMLPCRDFNQQRREQGFTSQAHLDAWFVAYDHAEACPECGQPGQAAWLEGSASWQPTVTQCAEAARLYEAAALVGRVERRHAHLRDDHGQVRIMPGEATDPDFLAALHRVVRDQNPVEDGPACDAWWWA